MARGIKYLSPYTYTVNSDCTGTFTITFTDGSAPVATAFEVVDNGNEIDIVVTSAGGFWPPAALAKGFLGGAERRGQQKQSELGKTRM